MSLMEPFRITITVAFLIISSMVGIAIITGRALFISTCCHMGGLITIITLIIRNGITRIFIRPINTARIIITPPHRNTRNPMARVSRHPHTPINTAKIIITRPHSHPRGLMAQANRHKEIMEGVGTQQIKTASPGQKTRKQIRRTGLLQKTILRRVNNGSVINS